MSRRCIEIKSSEGLAHIKNKSEDCFMLVEDIYPSKSEVRELDELRGFINGNGYKIEMPQTEKGLFSYMERGLICDLNVSGFLLHPDKRKISGFLVDKLGYSASIINCSVDGVILNGTIVGGLVGINTHGNINNCESRVSIKTEKGKCSGVVGKNFNLVKKCKFEGTIDSSRTSAGISYENKGLIERCSSECDIKSKNKSYSGGVVGYNSGKVRDSYFFGCIENGGGIAGENYGKIKDCYWSDVDRMCIKEGRRSDDINNEKVSKRKELEKKIN